MVPPSSEVMPSPNFTETPIIPIFGVVYKEKRARGALIRATIIQADSKRKEDIMAYTDVNRVFRPTKEGTKTVQRVLEKPSAYSPTPGYKPKLVSTDDLIRRLSKDRKS
jgi:hypothetical protein